MRLYIPHFLMASAWMALVLIPASGVAESNKAFELAKAVYDRPAGKDSLANVTMTIKGKKRQERIRKLSTYSLDKGAGERWTLMRFAAPADVKDTGLLTMDHPGDDSDQWIYLPALDRVRIISSKRKGGRFVGSDFTYEDLRDREPDMDTHKILGGSKVGGISCTLLEAVPVEKSNSIYTKRVSCVHEKTLTPLKVDFYQKGRSKPVKRMMARKLKKIQGYWTVLESTMYDLKTGNQTQLATTKIKFDIDLPVKLFSKKGLADPGMDKAYQ